MEDESRFVFFRRAYPSANMVLVRGDAPLLVDTGFGSDLRETEGLLREAGVPPERLALVVNTHYHCDHVGGNSGLQRRYGTPVAAHRWEASTINARDRDACSAEWLDQPVEPYAVDLDLAGGDGVETGGTTLQVIHTPGHTLGHISLWAPEVQTLILGDVAHSDDVAWINPFREGAGAMARSLETLDRLSRLPVRTAYSGHGPAIGDPGSAFDAARRRYEKWMRDPERACWHACKRIFAYALMIFDGLNEDTLDSYLLRCPWFTDFARHGFGVEPADFVRPLLEEMLRSKAAAWQEKRLVALPAHTPPLPGWLSGPSKPVDWPPASRGEREAQPPRGARPN